MPINETDVCVIIAAFNAQETIGRAVKSALLQDYIREVFVVDDSSQDDTANRARAQDDGSGRLSVVTLAGNRGPAAARNAALQRSRSAYVCTLDSNDYLMPQRISRLVTAAGASTWDMIADNILIVSADTKCLTLEPRLTSQRASSPRRPSLSPAASRILRHNLRSAISRHDARFGDI
jgi:succinoglycan biosynthesis protein ExoU